MFSLLEHASQTYAVAYFGLVIVMAVLEWLLPRRQPTEPLAGRWISNIGISLVNTWLLRLLFPLAAISWAALCTERHWGLFNRVPTNIALAIVLSTVALDFVRYGSHWLLHQVPFLWQIHATHHTDHDVDFTTGVRFHPAELLIAEAIGFAVIASLGIPPLGVLLFSLLSVAVTFFEHSNVHLPAAFDRVARLLVVTPDMHRVHHSRRLAEGNSNFGSIFPWWDRLCGTYLEAPAAGDAVVFGVQGFTERKHRLLHWMLAQPLLRPSSPPADVS